ncbi:RNA-binding protein 5 [Halotydeus destructor]|nr:RNA-binding protein 5 [Halotydeus destructor]
MGGSREYDNHDRDRHRDVRSDRCREERRYDRERRSNRRSNDRYSSEDEYERQDDRRHGNSRHRDRSRSRDRRHDKDWRSDRLGHEDTSYTAANDNYQEVYDNEDGFNSRMYLKKEEAPNNTIMIRNLAPEMAEADIAVKLSDANLVAKDIRLMRDRETGQSRGYAFVEFANLTEAIHWKEVTQSVVEFGNCKATLNFSLPKEVVQANLIQKFDWPCYKCGTNNFQRRDYCFRCKTGREESAANETGDEISPLPTNCLLFRNLLSTTTEERVLSVMGSLTGLPIKSIRIPLDPLYHQPRGVCLVELNSTIEATQLYALLSNLPTGFYIDSSIITVNYAKRISQNPQVSAVASNAASIALAAAKWTNQTDKTESNVVLGAPSTVIVNGVTYRKYPTPDPKSFQLDSTSGYFFDSSTQLYYEPKSKYYYNSKTQQYLNWSIEYTTYLPVVSNVNDHNQHQETIHGKEAKKPKESPAAENKSSDVKVTTAKKIAKDMEKWAKTLNQRTAKATLSVVASTNVFGEEEEEEDSAKDIAAAAASLAAAKRISLNFNRNDKPIKKKVEIVEDIEDIDYSDIIRAEEASQVDWDSLLCRICKRKLASKELLEKHLQISDVHKKNLENHLQGKLSQEQMEWYRRSSEDQSYRDRAKERRTKYGHPDEPIDSSHLKAKYAGSLPRDPVTPQAAPVSRIGGDNIGNKMLKKMGWAEGEGLGRQKQGRKEIIDVKSQPSGSGLGVKGGSEAIPGESYKEAVKRAMAQRYKELSEN